MIIRHVFIIPYAEDLPIFCVRLTLDFLDYCQLFLLVLLPHDVGVDLFGGFCRT